MRFYGFIHGVVSDEPKVVTPQGQGKPFLSFTVESPDSFSKYPNRVRCCVYGRDMETAQAKVHKGAAVTVHGEASTEAYVSQKTNKPVGVLKLFVRMLDVGGTGQTAAQSNPTPGTRQSAPAQPSPADSDEPPF